MHVRAKIKGCTHTLCFPILPKWPPAPQQWHRRLHPFANTNKTHSKVCVYLQQIPLPTSPGNFTNTNADLCAIAPIFHFANSIAQTIEPTIHSTLQQPSTLQLSSAGHQLLQCSYKGLLKNGKKVTYVFRKARVDNRG